MPYIKPSRRHEISIIGAAPETPGELNYYLTTAINDYKITQKLSYQTINDILGALEGAKLEFYRRVVVPYENTKMAENGDVY